MDENPSVPHDCHLDDVTGNWPTTQSFAGSKLLLLEAGKSIEDCWEEQENSGGNQSSSMNDKTQPLSNAHAKVDEGSSIVGVELLDELVELGRGWADFEKEWDLDKDDEGAGNNRKNRKDDGQRLKDVEEPRDSGRETNNHSENSSPLAVYTEVSRSELLSRRLSPTRKDGHDCRWFERRPMAIVAMRMPGAGMTAGVRCLGMS